MRWVADGRVVAGEFEPAGVARHAEDRHVVGALVAAVEEAARGVEGEAAWVVAAGPFVGDEFQLARWSDRKNRDAVRIPSIVCRVC